eukprot:10129859-Prorocentrum_lima.AAC.1
MTKDGTKRILERIITNDNKMPKTIMGTTKNGTTMGDGMAMIQNARQKKIHLHPKKKRNNQILLQDLQCRS